MLADPDILKYLLPAAVVVAGLAALGYRSFRRRYFFWISWTAGGFVRCRLSLLVRLVLKDYQIMRLVIFVNPRLDPQGAGWNIIQSVTAIGSGGLFGKGFLHGTQSHYQFLPQQSTDFIFSILAEEWGFLGALVVFGLFVVLLLRGMGLIWAAREDYALLVGTGILTMIFFHLLVNVGMAMGIMPITGIPLLLPVLRRLLAVDGPGRRGHPHEHRARRLAAPGGLLMAEGPAAERGFPSPALRRILERVERPGRYVGGEYGSVVKSRLSCASPSRTPTSTRSGCPTPRCGSSTTG